MKAGQVSAGEVLSSTIIICIQVADAPHTSVAVHVLLIVPVPMHPVICPRSSAYVIFTSEEVGHTVVAVADPVLSGVGGILQEMVRVGGQVMET